jgi:hypothetical protein
MVESAAGPEATGLLNLKLTVSHALVNGNPLQLGTSLHEFGAGVL